MSSIEHQEPQQNRVTSSPLDFGLWTLDLDLDCDNKVFVKKLPKIETLFDIWLCEMSVLGVYDCGELLLGGEGRERTLPTLILTLQTMIFPPRLTTNSPSPAPASSQFLSSLIIICVSFISEGRERRFRKGSFYIFFL